MNRLLIGGVALAVLLAGPAVAAEKALKAPAPKPAAFSWTGWYIGGNAGYMWGQTRPGLIVDDSVGHYFAFGPFVSVAAETADQLANLTAVQATGTTPFGNSGFTGGGQIGFNFQTGPIVSGAEVDFQSFNPKGSVINGGAYSPPFLTGGTAVGPCVAGSSCSPFAFTQSSSGGWLNTDRVRIGIAWDNWLVYGTVGLAVANVTFNSAFADFTTAPPLASAGLRSNFSVRQTRVGVAAGGGAEYAFAGPWSLRAEFLYVQIDRIGGDTLAVPTLGNTGPCTNLGGVAFAAGTVNAAGNAQNFCSAFKYDTTFAEFIVRAAINYRFDWAAPVVARY
jgi:outer membrane immunogenic protein